MIKLPRLPVNWDKQPQLFERYWNQAMTQIEQNVNELLALPIIQDAIAAAQSAADSALVAADAATTAAASANTAAINAGSVASLANSGVTGATITAVDAGASATISVTNHTRVYGDGSYVSVNGDSITGLAYSTLYYIYYDDPARAGGSVTYQYTTSQATAAQTGDRHLVGQVETPAAAAPSNTGNYVGAPGVGNIYL